MRIIEGRSAQYTRLLTAYGCAAYLAGPLAPADNWSTIGRKAMRCPSCHAENLQQSERCRTCGATLAGASSRPAARDQGDAAPERREATLLFADLRGYTEWTTEADVEEVAQVMAAIKDGAAEIVHTYGGVVNQFVGDEVMAVFGFPHGNEDDPRRAVNAALELHAFVRSARITRMLSGGRKLVFHSGIDTGVVLAQSRDVRDGLFDLNGSAVNRAARLRAEAAEDEILVSETTHRLIAPFFRTEALAARLLKGLAEPVACFRVQARRQVRSSFDVALERGLTPYIGRRAELATLESYLADAGRGEARLVSLAGPPGVGKTRLIHELAERARSRGFTVLRGQCQSYGNIPPFQPFLETLQDAIGLRQAGAGDISEVKDLAEQTVRRVLELDPALEPHLPVYLYLLSLSDGSRKLPQSLRGNALREAVIIALGAILIAHAKKRPVLVVVEDWHWADEASDALFRRLAQVSEGHSIIAVVTYRSDQLSDGRRPLSNRHLSLDHFDLRGTSELLRELLSSERLPEGLAEHVYEVTGGNPLFIEEVFQALCDARVLEERSSWWQALPPTTMEAPANVQAIVRARIDRLARSDKELLKLASVIGPEFSTELLQTLQEGTLPLSPPLERLEAAAHIVHRSSASYRFKHAIVQEVVYNVLLRKRRQELHGKIAESIEQREQARGLEPHYEALAHHYGRSEQREQAAHYAELAGQKAERSFSLEQARSQYALAIECLDELEPTPERMRRRVDLSLRWAAALVHNPAPGQLQVLQRSLDYAMRLDHTRGVALCLCWMGWVEYTLGNQVRAMAYNQRCLAMREQLASPALVAQVEANVGMSLVMAARFAEAEAQLAPALTFLCGREGESAAGYGYALGHLALMAADRGDFERADVLLTHARIAIEASGRYALMGAFFTIEGTVFAFRGDWASCEKAAQRVREVADRIDGAYQRHMADALEGLALLHGAGDARGIARLRAAALFLESRGMGLALSWTFACLAEALVLHGKPDEALAHADTAIARAAAGDGLGRAAAFRVRALAKQARGEDFSGDLQASLTAAREKQSPREELLTRLFVAQRAGEPIDGALIERLEQLHMPWYVARAKGLPL
jgi:class 3 adenylate cyclase